MPEATKRCPSCQTVKNVPEQFGYRTNNGRIYARTYCRECYSVKRQGGVWARTTEPLPPSPEGEARCPRCRETKPLDEFGRHSGTPSGRTVYCRLCAARFRRERIAALSSEQLVEFRRRKALSTSRNPETRKRARLRVFNMTLEQYEAMLLKQGGKCVICRLPETAKNKAGLIADLSVDHDHGCCPDKGISCGSCVRGLLCARCNNGLGQFRDDPQVLAAAIRYLAETAQSTLSIAHTS